MWCPFSWGARAPLLLALALAVLAWNASGEIPEELGQRYLFYRNNPGEVPRAARSSDVHYVLVTGLGGEFVPGYFRDLGGELERLARREPGAESGYPRTFILRPVTRKNPSENVALLEEGFREILEQTSPRARFVFIGHSKGAMELWTFLMARQELVAERTEGAFFIQGPFQGSPLADHLKAGESFHTLAVFQDSLWQSFLVRQLQRPFLALRPAVEELTLEGSLKHVETLLNAHGDRNEWALGKHAFFVATEWNAPGLSSSLVRLSVDEVFYSFCSRALGHLSPGGNDGFLSTASHQLPHAPNRAVVIPRHHHTGLVMGRRTAPALARAIYSLIHGP